MTKESIDVTCNACGSNFAFKPSIYTEGEYVLTYITCTSCKKVYPCHITNKKVRQRHKTAAQLQNQIDKALLRSHSIKAYRRHRTYTKETRKLMKDLMKKHSERLLKEVSK